MLAGFCELILGLQSVRGKILSPNGLAVRWCMLLVALGSVWGVEISQSRLDEHGEGVEKFGRGRLALDAASYDKLSLDEVQTWHR